MSIFKDISLIGKASGTIEGLEQERVVLQALVTKLELDLKTEQETLTHAAQEKSRLDGELANLKGSHKDIQEENDLILSQLHQVQEELERYYLDYQDAKQQNELIEQRLDRITSANPRFFNYESIECAVNNDHPERIRWKIGDLITAGSHWDVLEFDTVIEQGVAGIIFAQDDEGNSPLAAWPKEFLSEGDLECIPSGSIETAKERALILASLSASDWRLLTILPELLLRAIEQKKVGLNNENEWVKALVKTLDILVNHIPKKLRFDKAELVNYFAHPGYEHLHFRLHNLTFGDVHHHKFEFRLGCANVTKKRFGTHPRLEFPLVEGNSQLESWFAESEDELGPKLELRFAEPDSIDLNVWRRLNEIDQLTVAMLICELQSLINSIEPNFNTKDKTIEQWLSLARLIRDIFNKHITSQGLIA